MRIAVSSDEKTALTDFIVAELEKRGHQTLLFGPLKGEALPWTLASEQLALAVAKGEADEGVLFCYTGTGASMTANKRPGSRAPASGRRCAAMPPRHAAPAGGTTPMCW